MLKEYRIGLNVEEARKVSAMLGRDPTVVEAVIWGIQGSEHCSYKSSRRFLKMFPTKSRHVILGPGEDSGIVAITNTPDGKRWGIVVSHESHNHPSQIVPFEGAATGIGGVVRDVVCMGARVIGCMDMLRLGDLKSEDTRAIAKEVMRGIAGYGNPLGIPNLGGDTVFDASYNSNCLVNAVALGIVREDEVIHSTVPEEAGEVGYDIILVGKPTDRSGFGGAAFASVSMEEDKREQNAGAVQEPNPFLERHILASTYALFDWLVREGHMNKISYKDLGAGGVVCASVEQVAERGFGADVSLDAVHVALEDLPAEVIACAETQERLCWICHPDLTAYILKHYNEIWDLPSVAENARASVIGKVTPGPLYRLTYRGTVVCEAKSEYITSGLQYVRPVEEISVRRSEPEIIRRGAEILVTRNSQPATFSLTDIFLAMIGSPNGASKETLFKHFDKSVIGNGVIEAGEADAAVIMPLQDLSSHVHDGEHPGWDSMPEAEKRVGVAVAADGNGRYGRLSPYWQGANAAIESMRNVAAVGAEPRALTDCLNYGNPELPSQLWALSEGVRGISEAARGANIGGEPVPIISGNVSLYNSKPDGSAIDPTAIVACIGVLPDAGKAVTPQLKKAGLALLYLGDIRDECGGSLYYDTLEKLSGAPRDTLLGANVPQPDFATAGREIAFLVKYIQAGHIQACHDVSDGGLLIALFEMTVPVRKVGGTIGVEANLDALGDLPSDVLLFSQSGGYVLAVEPSLVPTLQQEAAAESLQLSPLGSSSASPFIDLQRKGEKLIQMPLNEAHAAWKSGVERAWNGVENS